jgi:hypothetical protein
MDKVFAFFVANERINCMRHQGKGGRENAIYCDLTMPIPIHRVILTHFFSRRWGNERTLFSPLIPRDKQEVQESLQAGCRKRPYLHPCGHRSRASLRSATMDRTSECRGRQDAGSGRTCIPAGKKKACKAGLDYWWLHESRTECHRRNPERRTRRMMSMALPSRALNRRLNSRRYRPAHRASASRWR